VCFYLRILADEEIRISRMQEERASQQEQTFDISNSESEELSTDTESEEGSDFDSDGSRQPRRPRKPRATTSQDPMKDARELFT
jgi:hypothetical protein